MVDYLNVSCDSSVRAFLITLGKRVFAASLSLWGIDLHITTRGVKEGDRHLIVLLQYRREYCRVDVENLINPRECVCQKSDFFKIVFPFPELCLVCLF